MRKTDTGPTLKERLAAWRQPGFAGFDAFLTDVLPRIPSERGAPQPFAWPDDRVKDEIRLALDGRHSTIVLCWPRRHGKTVMTALIICWRFLTRPAENIALVANSERQTTDTCFRLVASILRETPYTRRLIDEGAVEALSDAIRYPALGSTIQGFPSHPASLYGKKLTVAQISELHAARSDQIYQTLASSTIDSTDGLVLVDSTVGPRSSPLFGLYNLAQSGNDPELFFSHIEYRDLDDAIARGPAWIKPERLRSRAAQMLPQEFAAQHLNSWGGGSSGLFPPEIIERCNDSYPLDPKTIADGRAYAVGGGLDRAYGFSLHGDATVTSAVVKITGVDTDEPEYFVLASDAIPFSSAGGIKKKLSEYFRQFNMQRCTLESYNVQDIAAWAAEQPFASETVYATADRQSNIFTAMYNAASEGRLHIHPQFTKLLKEMETFEYELVRGQNGTSARFQHAKGCHDDHIYALAWAIYSLREVELNPYELSGIVCTAAPPVARLCALNGGSFVPPCAEDCASFVVAKTLHEQYKKRAGCAPMAIEDFISNRLTNIGIHSVRR